MPRQTRAAARAQEQPTQDIITTAKDATIPASNEIDTLTERDDADNDTGGKQKKRTRSKKAKKAPGSNAIIEPVQSELPGMKRSTTLAEERGATISPQDAFLPVSPLKRSARKRVDSFQGTQKALQPVAQDASSGELLPRYSTTNASTSVADKAVGGQFGTTIVSPANSNTKDEGRKDHTRYNDPQSEAIAIQRLESIFNQPDAGDEDSNGSTLAHIIARSPDKSPIGPRRRLCEDPIEALDALEDALEEVGRALPALERKLKKASPAPPLVKKKKSKDACGRAETKTLAAKPESGGNSITKQPLLKQRPLNGSKLTATRNAEMKTGHNTSATSGTHNGAVTIATGTPVKASRDVKNAISITALNTPPPSAKSSKPLTKSSFQLPSEATAARLKAQREERVRRQEAAAALKRQEEAKRRPSHRSIPKESRQTAPGTARKGVLAERNKNSEIEKLVKSVPSTKHAASPLTGAAAAANPPLPTARARPVSMLANSTDSRADTAKRARPSSIYGHSASSKSVQSGAEVPSVVKFAEEGVKTKAEAARKARAEAAERGRQASREWAEKMMRKQRAQAAASQKEGPASQ